MVNKKTTKKKIVKKKVGTRLKVSKGKGAKSTKDKPAPSKAPTKTIAKDKPSSDESSSKAIAVQPIASSSLNPLNKSQHRSNSHFSSAPKRSKKTLSIKDKLECSQVVTCLENILAGIKAGTLCIQQGEEFVTLKPQSAVDVEIEATVKKGKEKFVIELTWRSEREEKDKELRILSSEPIDELAAV